MRRSRKLVSGDVGLADLSGRSMELVGMRRERRGDLASEMRLTPFGLIESMED